MKHFSAVILQSLFSTEKYRPEKPETVPQACEVLNVNNRIVNITKCTMVTFFISIAFLVLDITVK